MSKTSSIQSDSIHLFSNTVNHYFSQTLNKLFFNFEPFIRNEIIWQRFYFRFSFISLIMRKIKSSRIKVVLFYSSIPIYNRVFFFIWMYKYLRSISTEERIASILSPQEGEHVKYTHDQNGTESETVSAGSLRYLHSAPECCYPNKNVKQLSSGRCWHKYEIRKIPL